MAIVVVRTAATNLADFFSVDLRLPKPWVMAGLALLLLLSLVTAWQLRWGKSIDKNDGQRDLLRADSGYWVAMLIAGTLGTVMGDFFSHDLHLGNALASATLSALLAPFFVVGARRVPWSLPFYWTTIVMIRAAGTVVGDLLAARNALGLPLSTAATGLLFIGLLLLAEFQTRQNRGRNLAPRRGLGCPLWRAKCAAWKVLGSNGPAHLIAHPAVRADIRNASYRSDTTCRPR